MAAIQLSASIGGRVLSHFPPVTYAFAYGSGAFHQPGLYRAGHNQGEPGGQGGRLSALTATPPLQEAVPSFISSRKEYVQTTSSACNVALAGSPSAPQMLDLVFAVQDSHVWHTEAGSPSAPPHGTEACLHHDA
jgi:hypothetical protein